MSEHHAPSSPERHQLHIEQQPQHERHHEAHEQEQHHAAEHRPSIEELTARVEAQAVSGKEQAPYQAHEQSHHPVLVNKQIKDAAYHRSLLRVQKRLSAPSRSFSRIVHSKALDKPSELASKTIARPSSMLGGALFAMIGTLGLYWLTNKYGYEYNYLLAILLFILGAVLGVIIEGVISVLKRTDS